MSILRIRYANQLAVSEFDLQDQVNLMKGEAAILKAILGATTQLDGFACTPDSPASLNVVVGEGTITILKDVLDTALGELPTQIPADTTHQIVKYAYTLDPTTVAITPPATPGFSRNDLIQISFSEADGNPASIPFYNGFNGQVLNPPTFATKDTQRIDNVVIALKPGTPAATGTQVTPSPDVGYVGAWVVTTAEGQTTITSGNIAEYPNAPFLTEKLKDKISQAFADARYVQISQATFLPSDNLIIGGDFGLNPWQRGTTFTGVADGDYTADRWRIAKNTTAVCNVVRQNDAPTAVQSGVFSQYSYRVNVTTADATIGAGEYFAVCQRIEGYRFTRIAQNTFSISFWAKTNKTGTYCIAFRNSGTDRAYVAEFTVDTADTWQQYTFVITASPSAGTWNYTTGIGLEVCITLAAGSTYQTTAGAWQTGNYLATSNQVNFLDNTSNYFEFDLVQAEPGGIPRQFLIRDYSEELALCQRYYWRQNADVADFWFAMGSFIGSAATTNFDTTFYLPVPMRTTPTVDTTGTLFADVDTAGTDTLSAFSVFRSANQVITIRATSANARANQTGMLTATDSTGSVALNSEL